MSRGQKSESPSLLNRSQGVTSQRTQLFSTSSLLRTASLDATEEAKNADSLRSVQRKNFVIKLQFAMIVLLALAALLLNFKVNRMCVKDPPIMCRADL